MITASIVLYNTNEDMIKSIVQSIINSNSIDKLFVIDNSEEKKSEIYFQSITNYEYIEHINSGYGNSHNIALKKAIELNSDYHIVLNPDITFDKNSIELIKRYMDSNTDVGYILPKVIYPNGELQYLCKLLPTPNDLIFRRFLPKNIFTKRFNDRYVLKHFSYNEVINPPCLSGCFMFLRCSVLKNHNLFFDDRFFMYFEDFDLIRRIHKISKTIYFPNVCIIHNHAKESYKSKKMLIIHIKSAIKYFNKWGWFFDKERDIWNKQILEETGYGNEKSI